MIAFECMQCFSKSETLSTSGRCPCCHSDAVLLMDCPPVRDLHRGTGVRVQGVPYLRFPDQKSADAFVRRVNRKATQRTTQIIRGVK
jgi:hypothetical protein